MAQYFIEKANIGNGAFFTEGPECRHIVSVMRRRAGDTVTIFDGEGRQYDGLIKEARPDFVSGTVSNERLQPEPPVKINLYFSAVSREATEELLDRCTQLGVWRFHPVMSARSERNIAAKWTEKSQRWNQLVLSACKQSGRAYVPEMNAPVSFAEAVKKAGRAVFADCGETAPLAEALKKLGASGEISVFIGPEGGWDDEERRVALAAGFVPVSLGRYTLRAETACEAAAVLLLQ